MCALLDDPAFVDDIDPVGVANRAQPVGNHDRRASCQEALQRALDQGLGNCVHTGEGRAWAQMVGQTRVELCDRKSLKLSSTSLRSIWSWILASSTQHLLVEVGCNPKVML